ncbi:protein unc-79 homolog [Watersipora subatra]|uniref:protein unc-79 homolog n=1 Tax=Watersipora subatra TaxID=2589382 RepID=UPI00355C1AA4
MATRELTFKSRINTFNDYLRQITSFAQPPPSGSDIANTLKYFSNTLRNVLKDAPNVVEEKFYGAKHARSNVRLTIFPTLNYPGLFEAICGLLPVAHLVTINQDVLIADLLDVIRCLVSFLTWDQLTQLPYKVTLMLPMCQPSHYSAIVELLCVYLLPNTLGVGVGDNVMVTEAIAGMLIIVLQHCTDPKLHSRLIECLLPLRAHLYKDLFTVIAYGPPNTKIPAVSLLFYYWPQLQSLLSAHNLSLSGYTQKAWTVPKCQRKMCINKTAKSAAKKICTHPSMCTSECELPPPVYICVDCYDTHGMRLYEDTFFDITLPADKISPTCDSKTCANPGSKAYSVCTSIDCVRLNRYRPTSLCYVCNLSRHPGHCGHVQESIANIWTMDIENQSYIVDAIVNLLREAEPEPMPDADSSINSSSNSLGDFLVPKVPAYSRYGILLLKELCHPVGDVNVRALGRLLAMLFQWFQCTATAGDAVENALVEKMKAEAMQTLTTAWVHSVKRSYNDLIVATLLPHPPDFAKVGGHWEKLSGRTEQMKEGLVRLIILGPYDIVSSEVWDCIMPYWLEAIRTELTTRELDEIKIPLKQVFDIEMSPLPFLLDNILHFIRRRFKSGKPAVQEQGLQWLQILTSVEIAIPVLVLLTMFKEGVVKLLQPPEDEEVENDSNDSRDELEVTLNCFILMLDIFLKQSELSKVTPHGGVMQNKSIQIFPMIINMIDCMAPLSHPATCKEKEGCFSCQKLTVFYQLVFNLLRIICPRLESSLPVLDVVKLEEINRGSQDSQREDKSRSTDSGESSVKGDDVEEERKLNGRLAKQTGSGDSPSSLHSLFVCLLQLLEKHTDVDICFYIVHALKSLFVHGQCLNSTYKTHPDIIEAFLKQQFIPRLWKMLDSRQSRTAKLAVQMLFHAIALGNGHVYFWSIVNGDCSHDSWRVRYAAADKIRMMWENSSANFLSKNQTVQTALAHVFCQYVTMLHDTDHNVSQRTIMQLGLLGENSLQAILKCMSSQFDMVVKDRQLILYKLSQLQNVMPERAVFSWAFFLARLQQLIVETELHGSSDSESGSTRGSLLKVSNGQSLEQMLKIAKFASMRCESLHSIKEQSGIYEKSSGSLVNSYLKDKTISGPPFLRSKGKKKSASQSDGSLQEAEEDQTLGSIGMLIDVSQCHTRSKI